MRWQVPVVLVGFVAAAGLWAHHGSAGFDQNKPLHFTGKINSVEWVNPHVVVHVEVAAAEGSVATWLVNTRPPNAAKRMGFPESAFAIGAQVTVDGYQAIDGSNRVNGTSIEFQDGKKITTPDCFNGGPYCYTAAPAKAIRVQ